MNLRSAAITLGTFFVLAQSVFAAELRAPTTRSALETYLEDIAIAEMEKLVDRPPFRIMYNTAAGGAANKSVSHSTTNVQVQGVDEPDFVKNDGGYIYKTVGEEVSIIDAYPATQMREIARYKADGYANALFLSGSTLVVFSTPAKAPAGMERPDSGRPGGWWGGPMVKMAIWGGPVGGYNPICKVTLLDVTRPSTPRVKREMFIEGNFVDARLVGNEMHVVTSAQPPGPTLKWWDWANGQPTTADLDALKVENRRTIRAATLDDWLPRQLDKANSSRPEALLPVGRVYRPAVAEGRNVLSVSTLDISTRYGRLKSTAMIGETGELYASKNALYVACYRWRYWTESGIGSEPGDKSEIHKFLVGGGYAPYYAGTGEVEGRVLNQFAMDEWNGSLRVATTTEATGASGQPQLNHLFVLRPLAWWSNRLYKIGEIRDIAPTERIYSTRFLGDRAFVVTFRQVDPLFAIDMRRLQVKGELKVDGFSTYLHPVGTGHLLAVGNAVDPATNRITGLDLSLFDVRDLAAPKLAHRKTIPGAWSTSLYEHKAFTYFESNGTLAVPINDWANGFSGMEVYNVSLTSGFRLRGRVDHADLAAQLGWTWGPDVSRSIIIGSAIYSVSEAGVKANRTLDPRTEHSSVVFRQPTP